jgi:hypothetical protein
MKKLILAALCAASLAGCASQTALQQASSACESYYAVQQTTLAFKNAGKLTDAQLAKFKAADAVAVKACNAPPPTTAASAAALASNVTTQMGVLTAINQGVK